jgi:transcription elongation factor Elf1
MDAEFECIACNVKRIIIAVTPVAKGYEMRCLECPQCSNLLRLVLRHPRSYSKTLGRRLTSDRTSSSPLENPVDKMAKNQTKALDKKPQCVKCGSKMRFSCTETDKPGFVHHVYECTKCRSTQSFVTPV